MLRAICVTVATVLLTLGLWESVSALLASDAGWIGKPTYLLSWAGGFGVVAALLRAR